MATCDSESQRGTQPRRCFCTLSCSTPLTSLLTSDSLICGILHVVSLMTILHINMCSARHRPANIIGAPLVKIERLGVKFWLKSCTPSSSFHPSFHPPSFITSDVGLTQREAR